jgi:hypothetical protein
VEWAAKIAVACHCAPGLLDAARVDGCGEPQTFLRVALRFAKPVVALVFFFSFVADWLGDAPNKRTHRPVPSSHTQHGGHQAGDGPRQTDPTSLTVPSVFPSHRKADRVARRGHSL